MVVEFEGDDFVKVVGEFDFGEIVEECDVVLEVDDEIVFDEFGEIEELVDLCVCGDGVFVVVGVMCVLVVEEFGFGDDDVIGGVSCGGRVGGEG